MNYLIIGTARILLTFVRFAAYLLYMFGSGVYTALNGNEDFPKTQVLLPGLLDALTALNEAIDNAKNRDKIMVEIKETARKALVAQLRQIALSCMSESLGNRLMLLGSGFDLTKDFRQSAVMVPPIGFKLTDGNTAGKLVFTCTKGKNMDNILYEITEGPITAGSVWRSEPGLGKKHIFTGLISHQLYFARMRITSNNGQEFISSPISRTCQ